MEGKLRNRVEINETENRKKKEKNSETRSWLVARSTNLGGKKTLAILAPPTKKKARERKKLNY